MKILKKLILIILIIILIYVMYCKYVKKEELIKIFGNSILVVTTGSMQPTIDLEELIVISEKEKYKIGDIVTYKDEDNLFVTHRIVELKENIFITKGDANNLKDNPHEIDKIQGKVVFHSKILGIFVLYLLKPIIIIYIIIIFCIESIKKDKKLNSE